jgi:predicted SAM-dependent methyltransferase
MHHVNNTRDILRNFYDMLNPGGYLSIADLYTEDGSFHGDNFTGHKGFDPEHFSAIIAETGFKEIKHRKCFTLQKPVQDGSIRDFDVFILVARKP